MPDLCCRPSRSIARPDRYRRRPRFLSGFDIGQLGFLRARLNQDVISRNDVECDCCGGEILAGLQRRHIGHDTGKGARTTVWASWRAASSRVATASLYLGWFSIGASGSPFRWAAMPVSCCCDEASFCCDPCRVLRAAS